MICKNCGAYFVRPPCPSCGMNGDKKEKERSQSNQQQKNREILDNSGINTSSQIMLQKKKEMNKLSSFQHFEREKDQDEQLVKPSTRLDKDKMPSFQRIELEEEEDEQLVKPSQRVARQLEEKGDLPSFKKYEKEVQDQQISKDMEKIHKRTVSVSNHETKLKNDVEYRKRVKETLVEVMDLLEKLIE